MKKSKKQDSIKTVKEIKKEEKFEFLEQERIDRTKDLSYIG